MAKFCANCGFQMEDGDKVCGRCGTPVAGATPAGAGVPPMGAAPAGAGVPPMGAAPAGAGVPPMGAAPAGAGVPPMGAAPAGANAGNAKGGNNIVKIIIAAIVAIVVIVIAANVIGSFTGYKGALNKMIKALRKEDVAALENLASSISEETYGAWYGDDLYDYYEDAVSDTLDKYEDKVGNIKKISYEITDVTELSDRRVKELEENLVDRYNMDVDGLKKVVKVDLKITVKGTKKSSSFSVSDLYVIKESGGWKIYYGNLNY